MPIVLTQETETKLRDRAGREGQDADHLAESLLAALLEGKLVRLGPDIPYVDDEDYASLDVLIAEAEADFAAGRFKTLEQIRVAKREQFGIEL